MNRHTPEDERRAAEVGSARNVMGSLLEPCVHINIDGYFVGHTCCVHGANQRENLICSVMSEDFLRFSAENGVDLSMPRPKDGFPGLKPGEHWCLSVAEWYHAYQAGHAPKVVLEATHEDVLTHISPDIIAAIACSNDFTR